MKINFLDLKTQYHSIKPEVDEAILNVLESSAFAEGPSVKRFEENFAEAHNAKYCVAVNSGTAALHLLMMALDFSEGDEVIIPANTFFATPEAVSLTGAKPVFVDCEQDFYNIDVLEVEKAITPKTKAIIAVHLYGQPANLKALKHISDKNGIILLEDSSQAHLARFGDKPIGCTLSLAGTFSFYPGKNLGAYGEGGAIVTNDEQLYTKLKKLKNHGSKEKYKHEYVGHNYRMDGIQGAILDVKLKYLPEWTEKRRKLASLYVKWLLDVKEVALPALMENVEHVYHLFIIRVKCRSALAEFLKENGIQTGIHYPIPCHLQEAYHSLGYQEGSFPVTEEFSNQILSLPMSEQLKDEEVKYVCEKIKEFFFNYTSMKETQQSTWSTKIIEN